MRHMCRGLQRGEYWIFNPGKSRAFRERHALCLLRHCSLVNGATTKLKELDKPKKEMIN